MQQSERIAQQLREEIATGEWPIGCRLPSEKELSARFGVAPGTVRIALRALVEEGSLGGGRGARKTVVGMPAPPDPFERFQSFAQWATQNGHRPGGMVYRREWQAALDADAQALKVDQGSPVLAVTRLRTLDEEPVLIERTRYAAEAGRAADQLPDDCPAVTAALTERFGIGFARAHHVFGAVSADADDARFLGVEPAAPLLAHRRISYDRRGRALEWSEDRYRSGTVAVAVGNSWAANPLRWTEPPRAFPQP